MDVLHEELFVCHEKGEIQKQHLFGEYSVSTTTHDRLIADVNGDGNDDFVIAYAGGGRAMKREMYATGSKSGRTKKKTEAGAVARKQTAKTTGEKVMKAVKTIGKIVVPGAAAVDAGVRLSKFLNRKK